MLEHSVIQLVSMLSKSRHSFQKQSPTLNNTSSLQVAIIYVEGFFLNLLKGHLKPFVYILVLLPVLADTNTSLAMRIYATLLNNKKVCVTGGGRYLCHRHQLLTSVTSAIDEQILLILYDGKQLE